MCNRQKPITKAEVDQLKVIMENRTRDLEYLTEKMEAEGLTKDEHARALEHVKFIKQNAPVIKAFYRPAMVITE